MVWGRPTRQQERAIAEVVRGKVVHDLGCGGGDLSRWMLLEAGAAHVHAVDSQPNMHHVHAALTFHQKRFSEYNVALKRRRIPVAFISWPANNNLPGMLDLVRRSETVVYLGTNTDGTACGYAELFKEFLRRRLLKHVPDRRNTLLVLGPPQVKKRVPTGEELAALSKDHPLDYATANGLSVVLRELG